VIGSDGMRAAESPQDGFRRVRFAPGTLFFPAATAYAAGVLPWSVLSMSGVIAGPSSLSTPFGHAHEMLLGYALAVVAGHQLPLMTRSRAVVLLVMWGAARLAFVALHGGIAFALNVVFAAVLALHVAPRLFGAAKKLRNHGLPAFLTVLCVGAIAFDAAAFVGGVVTLRAVLTVVVLSLAALMLFMGGRIIAPAAAGQFYRQGASLAARVQPRIEGLLLAIMAGAVVSAIVPGFGLLLRMCVVAAGMLALVRLLRWRLWGCKGRPDLVCLGVGYAWLALGLMAMGALAETNARSAALHLVTVGALGTLTLNVMATTVLLKRRRSPAAERTPALATALVAAATVFRVAAAFAHDGADDLLVLAAVCWSSAFVAVLWLIARCLLAPPRRGPVPRDLAP